MLNAGNWISITAIVLSIVSIVLTFRNFDFNHRISTAESKSNYLLSFLRVKITLEKAKNLLNLVSARCQDCKQSKGNDGIDKCNTMMREILEFYEAHESFELGKSAVWYKSQLPKIERAYHMSLELLDCLAKCQDSKHGFGSMGNNAENVTKMA